MHRAREEVRGWSVVMTKPNCENLAVANLERQGYDTYFPRFAKIVPGKPLMIRPLFPRYLFVFILERWYSIRGTRGVSSILTGDSGPAIIASEIVDAIRNKEDEKGLIVLNKAVVQERFTKGEKVKATDGPFAGIDLIYEDMAPHERVKVLANMLGRQVPILIEEKLLASA